MDSVYTAIAAGYRHIDTAWKYEVEKEVGEGIRKAVADGICKREDIVVVTKVWPTNFAADRVVRSATQSNESLGLGHIDVLLLHFPVPMHDKPGVPFPLEEDGTTAFDDSTDVYNETWKAMEQLVDRGIAKSIGVSNFSSAQIETLVQTARIKPVVNQVESHPLLPQEKLLATCKKHDIVLTAYSPFAGSPRPAADGTLVPSDLKAKLYESEITKGLAIKYKKSVNQILLKFHVARGVAVIPKSVTKERIIQNTQLFDFELLPEELDALRSMETGERLVRVPGVEKSQYFPYTD